MIDGSPAHNPPAGTSSGPTSIHSLSTPTTPTAGNDPFDFPK
jgi:hypothetical protein